MSLKLVRCVVHVGQRAQFRGFFFRRSVTEKVAAADLRPRKILQQIRPPQRWMKLDVEMKSTDSRRRRWAPDATASRMEKASARDCRT